MYLFHCYVWAFSSCREQGPPLVVARGLLFAAASLVAEHRLWVLRLSSGGSQALEHRLSSWGAWA